MLERAPLFLRVSGLHLADQSRSKGFLVRVGGSSWSVSFAANLCIKCPATLVKSFGGHEGTRGSSACLLFRTLRLNDAVHSPTFQSDLYDCSARSKHRQTFSADSLGMPWLRQPTQF